jgi:hypothetical protein
MSVRQALRQEIEDTRRDFHFDTHAAQIALEEKKE